MAKMLRGVDYEMAGISGSKKKAKKKASKKGSKKSFSMKGFKVASEKACLRKSGPLKGKPKKGCVWGRGKFKGKLLKKVA